ncbi:Pogo transposable element with KRAB domain, partial [Frankliniella fusca]
MELALNAIRNGGMSIRSAAKNYGVPYVSLNRHYKGATKTFQPGRKPKLQTYESELRDAVVIMVDMGHGASKQDVMDLAVQTAEKAERSPFKNREQRPSDRWYKAFMKRQQLCLRQPENMSAARFRMATIQVRDEFFSKLKEVFDKLLPLGLKAGQIYNTDETGLCVVTKSGKVIAPKGSRNVRARTGGERGENVTAIVTVNASGSHILPPTLIYRGKSLNFELTDGAPEGTVFGYSKKSFIDSELFVEWFQRFIDALPPPRPVLLLMDGHACHIQLKVIEMARANSIHILCFPPHTTSYLQPLDVGVFKPLKSAFSQESSKLIRKNKLKQINRYQVARVLGSAWAKAITPMNIQGGFRGSGIWPYNPDAFVLPGVHSDSTLSTASDSPSDLEQSPILPIT